MDQEMQAFEARLDNWGLVVRDGMRINHCGSVEYRYRPERGEAFEQRRMPCMVIDVADGWRVERAWQRLGVAHQRWLLKLHFVRKLPRNAVIKWVAKRTGHAIKTWHYQGEQLYAMRQLKKMLDMPECDPDNCRQQLEFLLKQKSVLALSGATARPKESEPALV